MLKMSKTTGVVTGCLTIVLSTCPQAQPAKPSSDAKKTEIIEVVAQKRRQNIQKVGISVTAIDEMTLKQLAVDDTVDITEQVPNLQLNAWSPNLTIFNLRGVSQNSFTDNLEGPIAVYMDDAYLGSLNGVSTALFDVRRVEVLRGPQGTLFGRNATGGLIHYISHLADEDNANGYMRLVGGSDNAHSLELAYGNELTHGLRARAALKKSKADGYIKAADPALRAVGGEDNLAAKLALQWDVNDSTQLDVWYRYSKDTDVPTGGYTFLPWTQNEIDQAYIPPELMDFTANVILDGAAPPGGMSLLAFTQQVFFNPDDGFTPVDDAGLTIYRGDHPNPYTHYSNIDGHLNRQTHNLTAKLSWQPDSQTIFESITNVNRLKKDYLEDGDGIAAPIIAFATEMDYRQLSQEFRVSRQNDRFNWQLGSYYLVMEHDGLAATIGSPVIRLANTLKADGLLDADYDPASGSPQAIQDYLIDAENIALFAQGEWQLGDTLWGIAGARWSKDDKSLYYARGFADQPADIAFISQTHITPADSFGNIEYDDTAFRLQLNWQPNEQQMWFASINKGIKVGNWAFSAGLDAQDLEHLPETIYAFELGLKSSWPQRRMRLNATGFYYDYQDYQAFSMLGLAPQIRNTDAQVYGGEVELFWQATDSFDVTFGAGYLSSNVDEVKTVERWSSPVGGTVIDFPVDVLYDRELPNAPKWSFNYQLQYFLAPFDNALSIQFDGVYYDEQYLEVTNGGGSYQKAYGISNLRLFYQGQNSPWQLSLWAKNLFDKTYKQYSLDLGMLGATAYYAPGRKYGASIEYQF